MPNLQAREREILDALIQEVMETSTRKSAASEGYCQHHPDPLESIAADGGVADDRARNQYLSCRVLPDLGGHLHGCTDRIANREVFYANPAIRRGPESVRRAFIATGIESSFPFAHSRVASSPADFGYSVEGGIGKVVVGDTDRVSGMEWRVEFILREGSTVLEQRVTLHNGSAARRGYHWWANAAVELDDPHLQFVGAIPRSLKRDRPPLHLFLFFHRY